MRPEIRDLLVSVRSPFRYVGGEVGCRAKPWDECDVRVCLAFPEVYEIGMSHLGLSILYHIVNDEPRMLAERAFAPWIDMEAELKKRGMPLFSLESHRLLGEFDVIGFSLAYELTYTNVLTMLDLAGIPWRSSDRTDSHPLVIAGGPCAFNPLPVAPFFDAIVIGDGEGAILEIANAVRDAKRSHAGRRDLLNRLSKTRGVYVPMVHGEGREDVPTSIGQARIPDLNSAPFPRAPVVPHMATHQRIAVEVARGCGRGCRFCQAGYIYRPVRQRSGEGAAQLACAGVAATGCEDFSFLSLSIGDWAPLEAALGDVHALSGGMPVNATLPSLRVETLSQPVINSLGGARSGGFTLAPEAGSERLRRFINKGNMDADLYASAEKVFAGGWHAVKLYFMVGFPGETEADIDGIVEIANRCMDIGRRFHRRPEVTVSTSTFVPKAHTPFQWERQISIDETEGIQRILKRRLRRPGLFYRWHDAGMSFLEGIFSRGGAELSRAIEGAHAKGARFDGWDECLDLARWREAFAEASIDPESYLDERDEGAAFPWERLGIGPSRDFLLRERERAYALAETPDCTRGDCSACGVCDFEDVRNRIAENVILSPAEGGAKNPVNATGSFVAAAPQDDNKCVPAVVQRRAVFKYRIRYRKTGRAAFLGSIETLDAMRRALRAARLGLCYSQGFTPRVRVSAGPALSVGIESEAEFVDVELAGEIAAPEIVRCLAGRLPEGMEAACAWPLEPPYRPIEASIASTLYEVYLEGPGVIEIAIPNERPAPRLKDVLAGGFGVDDGSFKSVRIRKVGVEWRTS